ncbi:MAG: excinuclease ABC subunit UvrB [Bacteroidota bacterium]
MNFKLVSDFQPTGDQPEAIAQLIEGLNSGTKFQTLLGVTGSGKTFTIANVIEKLNRPVLVFSHNKTLAAQLYSEFKNFFPENSVEYFVSYYDYYQPEAYIPITDTYIEKDLSINDEIEKLRLSASSALLSGRRDVIVVSSVSCIYGIGNPADFHDNIIRVKVGEKLSRNKFLRQLVDGLYSRSELDFTRSKFRVKGDTVDIYLAYDNYAVRVVFWGDEIEKIQKINPENGNVFNDMQEAVIFPANIFITSPVRIHQAIKEIQNDLFKHVNFLKEMGKNLEAKRLEDRVTFDLEMIKEIGHCPGIENYSRYFDGRPKGARPFCLLDYFPDDYLMIIDESHATLPQVRAMYGGDRSRKETLVEFGFRLPAALDNRPLKFDEFEKMFTQAIFVSATPADYELEKSEGIVVDQVIRPTGLPDPQIEVRSSLNQIDDLIHEINIRVEKDERILVTTLTKRMAEELTKYMEKMTIRCRYVHSDVITLDRVEILDGLRKGLFDVLVGVNLLREGLDLPEVSLVAILDADKEGFLRNARSLTQTAGRAARNIHGKVIMYADKTTRSMQMTIDETNRRREKQLKYNADNNITPAQIVRSSKNMMGSNFDNISGKDYFSGDNAEIAADPVVQYMTKDQLQKAMDKAKSSMEKAAKELNFIEAALYRDEMRMYQKKFNE